MIGRMIATLLVVSAGLSLRVPQEEPAGSRLPESPMTAPLYLAEEPPECRSLRSIRIPIDVPAEAGPDRRRGRTTEEALELARSLQGMLRAGAEFETLARTHSRSPQAREGGVLGTYPRGVLLPSFDRFLFTAGIGDVSEPIVEGEAVHLLQRIERWAACRQIFLKGRGDDVRAKAQELVERLRGGEDYLALAREHSDDPKSARRGGAWSIFERGADDTLLKKATFDASVGEIFGPLHSPLGFHIGKREALEVEHDPASGFAGLRESNWVRATGLLVAHEKGKEIRARRTLIAANDLATELFALARARELPLAKLAKEHTDEPGGRERAGDLGWIYRGNPNRLRPLEKLFLVRPGTLLEPRHTDEGWILLQRTH